MSDLRFTWDRRKSLANKRTHRVAFEEARTVFADENALLIADQNHSAGEDRFVLLGLSSFLRVLVVCHVYRESEQVIRIISARKANASERTEYARRLEP